MVSGSHISSAERPVTRGLSNAIVGVKDLLAVSIFPPEAMLAARALPSAEDDRLEADVLVHPKRASKIMTVRG
jgi:hypothetical protein